MKPCSGALVLMLSCIGGATAADAISVPLSTSAQLPIYDKNAFDWSGFYAGVQTGARAGASQTGLALGIQAGVQAQFDFYLIGAEVAVRGLAGSIGSEGTTYAQVLGRAGVVANDSLSVYTAAGVGLEMGAQTEQDALFGGGLEIPLTDSISLNAQYLRGLPVNNAEHKNIITFGANWHF